MMAFYVVHRAGFTHSLALRGINFESFYIMHQNKTTHKNGLFFLVRRAGFEPATISLRGSRSTN